MNFHLHYLQKNLPLFLEKWTQVSRNHLKAMVEVGPHRGDVSFGKIGIKLTNFPSLLGIPSTMGQFSQGILVLCLIQGTVCVSFSMMGQRRKENDPRFATHTRYYDQYSNCCDLLSKMSLNMTWRLLKEVLEMSGLLKPPNWIQGFSAWVCRVPDTTS